MLEPDVQMKTLTALDRCDRCRAQAYAVAEKPQRADLLFCLHHIRIHHDALLDQNWTVTLDYENVEDLVSGYTAPV